jgi:hypothetical protein
MLACISQNKYLNLFSLFVKTLDHNISNNFNSFTGTLLQQLQQLKT